jgi:putative transposase
VHQIRNSLKYVSWKERKEIAKDLKTIYTAVNIDDGFSKLGTFANKWDKKYPHISKSWYNNWGELSTFYKYSAELRTLIYTTNPIESFNRGLKKVSKNRAIFPTEQAVTKLFYLAIGDIQKRWTQKIRDWGNIYSQLWIYFEDRLREYRM